MKQRTVKAFWDALVFSLVFVFASGAQAACSSYLGQIVFNEVQDPSSGTTYLELRILSPSIVSATTNFTDWTLEANRRRVSTGTANRTTANLGPIFTNTSKNICGTQAAWVRIPDADIGGYINGANPNYDLNFVLRDSGGNMVDLLRMGTVGAFRSFYSGSGSPTCASIESSLSSTANTKYDQEWGSNGNKDWYRSPDGAGTWGSANVSTANNANSICNDNNASAPGMLGLTKTVSSATVAVGATVTFTLTAQNPLTGATLINATVTDSVPSGLTVNAGSCSVTDGVGCSISGNTVTWTVATAGSPLSVNTSRSATFTATAATTGSYTNTITANTAGTPTASAMVMVSPGVSGFWVYDAFGSASVSNRILQTRVAGGSNLCTSGGNCAVRITATNAGVASTSYSGTVSAQLQTCGTVARSGSGASSTVSCTGGWTNIGTAQSVTLSSGTGTVTFPAIAAAHEIVRVQVTGASVTANSEDVLAIRPASLGVVASQADALTAGTTQTLNSKDMAGTVFHRAGRPFTFTVTPATTAGYSSASSYTPVLQVALNACTGGNACTPSAAALALGGFTASGGVLTYNTASYGGIGAVDVQLQDATFAVVDQSDTAADCTGYYSCSAATAVGRFVPDHFMTAATMACNTFSYSGQPFTVTVTAQDASNASLTQYAGSFARTVTLSNGGGTGDSSLWSGNSAGGSGFVNGVATLTPSYTFESSNLNARTLTVQADEPSGADSTSSSGATQGTMPVQAGRVRLLNAYGSEKLDLPMTMRAEFWNGSGWQTNTADACTTTALLFAAVSGVADVSASTCVWDSGSPGASAQGCASAATPAKKFKEFGVAGFAGDFNLWLKAPLSTGALDVTAVVPGWLQYNWRGTVANPTARATFGIYKSPLIYRRENY